MSGSVEHWKILLARQAEKALLRLSKKMMRRIDQAIVALVDNPRPAEAHQLSGYNNLYRLQIGEWRVVYAVEDERLIILILEVAPQKKPNRYQVDKNMFEILQDHYNLIWNEEKILEEQKLHFAAFARQMRGEIVRLLVVDPISATRHKLIQRISGEPDLEVVGTTTTGEEALQKAIGLQPDIVLMEIILPNMDSLTVCREISRQVPAAKVIMMSAYSEPDHLRRSIQAGARDFITKDISRRELINTIHRVNGFGTGRPTSTSEEFQSEPNDEKIYVKISANLFQTQVKLFEILAAESTIEIVREITDADIILTDTRMTHGGSSPSGVTPEMTVVQIQDRVDYLGAPIVTGARDLLPVPFSKDELMASIRRVYAAKTEQSATKAATQKLKSLKLGMYLEISLSVTNLVESLSFYQKLGLKKIDGGAKPHPWALLSDETLHIGIHQRTFPSPMLRYFSWGGHDISFKIDCLKTLNVAVEQTQWLGISTQAEKGNFDIAVEFDAFEGQRIRLADFWREINSSRRHALARNKFGELSLKTSDIKAAVSYWEQLGFERVAENDQPYPSTTLSDGLIRLGLHQTSKFAKPTISYFAPDMADRIEQFRTAGLEFLSEQKDAAGRSVGAVVKSPDGQPIFLFTGQVTNLN